MTNEEGLKINTGLLDWMFIVMFALKLAGVFNASWVIVTLPVWAPLIVSLIIVIATISKE